MIIRRYGMIDNATTFHKRPNDANNRHKNTMNYVDGSLTKTIMIKYIHCRYIELELLGNFVFTSWLLVIFN